MKLIALAKSIQPFIQQGVTLEAVYKEILTNTSLPFKTMLRPIDLIKLVFITKKISNNEDPSEIMSEFDNNVFIFSTVEFGDNNQTIDCQECMSDGTYDCHTCDGSGEEDCDECGGSGEVGDEGDACNECQGGGKVTCSECDGEGQSECGYCDGQGYNDTQDFVTYDLNYYVSYDNQLKTTLDQKLLRNNTQEPVFNSKKTFLLASTEVGVDEGESESIQDNFANTTHLLEISGDEVTEELVYGNGRIIPSGFYDDLDKFM